MNKLEKIVPPLELCKLIPAGKFADSALIWVDEKNGVIPAELVIRKKYDIPAPTLQEIMGELHKHQEDVFIKWSENAYHEWLVNAYSHNKDDFQAHDKNSATAALKVWLQMKGIEYAK